MKKDTILGAGILLIILGGIIFYVATRPAPEKAPGIDAGSIASTSYVEHAQYYDIATNYASSTPLHASAGAAANTAAVARMKKFVTDTISQFKTDGNFANLTPEDVKALGFNRGNKETLQISYLIASSARTVSYIFTTYEDTGGAHGNTFFHTFTFDTTKGTELSLSSIFTTNSYLNTLSSLSRTKLPAVIGDGAEASFINGGTTPEEKNFQNFFFDNQEFVLLFDPYQVAPYSSGPQTLRIPLSELANILKPEYR